MDKMSGYMQGDMKPKVEDMQKPESCYSQMYDQSTLNYVERQNRIQKSESSQIKSQKHKGRY